MSALVSVGRIESLIYVIRGQKVMLDEDLARLYGVPTKALNQAVQRNIERFPFDFMFQLTNTEYGNLKSQIVTSRWGGRRKSTSAFTEQGVAMLSSVLRSKNAIQINIAIMRAFIRLKQFLFTHKEFADKLRSLGHILKKHDMEIGVIIQAMNKMVEEKKKPKRRIGFMVDREEN